MKIALVANIEKEEVQQIVPDLVDKLHERRVDFCIEQQLAQLLEIDSSQCSVSAYKEICASCDLVISFGGDGTILSTAREIGTAAIPILGVKIGGMGFLAELTPDELLDNLDGILQKQFDVVERMLLQVEFDDEETPLYALNDIVLDKGAVSRINRIKIFVDDEFLNTYIGDGLIVSTPTGSTAYSLAAGGPILLPTMQAIIVNPINPHTLGARPVVIPASKQLRVEVELAAQKVLLSADGQVTRELSPGNSAVIRRGDYSVRLVSFGKRSFFDVLRAKLNWGDDVRKGSGEPSHSADSL